MTGVAQEAAAVGQHTHKVAQQAKACQTDHLILHADLVVVEPPCGAVLDLARHLAVLEAAQNGADLCIVGGVQAVNDGLGALIGVVQGAEQLCDLAAAGGGVDHVKAGVGAQQAVHLAVHAAQAVVVDLHGNAQTMVLLAQMDQDVGLVLLSLFHGAAWWPHGRGCSPGRGRKRGSPSRQRTRCAWSGHRSRSRCRPAFPCPQRQPA